MVLKHKKILITELEMTWEGGLVISHHLKKAKYQDLINKALVHEWKTAAIVSKDVKNNHIADKTEVQAAFNFSVKFSQLLSFLQQSW